ncbi:hypothetical protein [Phocaeicola faecalis]
MEMYKHYSGEFLSNGNVRWKVEIYQEAEVPFATIRQLRFPAARPLVIEWGHTDKEEAICGSTATLTVISPGDRTYANLYTIRAGSVRMEVSRNGALYWSGTLDPEFYEEPYSSFKEYEVKLTFSDFGILDRYKFSLTGVHSLQTLVAHALSKSGIRYQGIDQSCITTSLDGKTAISLADLSIRSENFYDEDNEPCSLYEVLEGILQPLALRIIQKNGIIRIYDLNGLYTLTGREQVEWTDSDQRMGVDKVVNNAKVTFSPYSKAQLLESNIVYIDTYDEGKTNLTSDLPGDGLEYYSYYPDYAREGDYKNLSFTIFISNKGTGLAEKYAGARYFHIEPLLGGSQAEGVAYSFYTGGHGDLKSGWPKRKLNNPAIENKNVLMRTLRVPIQNLQPAEQNKFFLRLSVEMMIDPRYNPFTEAGQPNESGNYNTWKKYAAYTMIPATVTLYDDNGNALMHYSNEAVAHSGDKPGDLFATTGKWQTGAAAYGSCWLSWYNVNDRSDNTGVLGWQTNRHCIGLSTSDLKKSFAQMDAGQYIPYPPAGGYMEVCIYGGVRVYSWNEKDWESMGKAGKYKLWDMIRWMLFKAPKLDLVKNNTVYSHAESKDLEYNGVINAEAKDELSIDTICGTMQELIPSARGVYLSTADACPVSKMSRGGYQTQVEQLLIGTLYSQYAGRKTKLTGTARLLADGLQAYTEACQKDKIFICLSDVQNVIADESDLEIVELRPDEYKAEK